VTAIGVKARMDPYSTLICGGLIIETVVLMKYITFKCIKFVFKCHANDSSLVAIFKSILEALIKIRNRKLKLSLGNYTPSLLKSF
jgi:hypothetical protein